MGGSLKKVKMDNGKLRISDILRLWLAILFACVLFALGIHSAEPTKLLIADGAISIYE
jgi:hypothetical protein